MKKLILFVIYCIEFFLIFHPLAAQQNDSVVILSPRVGSSIDLT